MNDMEFGEGTFETIVHDETDNCSEVSENCFEMSTVRWGFMGIKLAIYGDEGTEYPHFHFYKHLKPERGIPKSYRSGGGCLCIESPNYFIHATHTEKLDQKEIDGLIEFLKETNRSIPEITNWVYIIGLWNDNNPDMKQLSRNIPIPDYKSDMETIQVAEPIDERSFEPKVDYYIEDISTVRRVDEENILIAVNPEIGHLCAPYFRVYNSSSLETATAIARLHFKDSGMEWEYDERDKKQGVPIWNILSDRLEKVIEILLSPIEDDPDHTYWQFACYQWNYENNLIPPNSMQKYLNGDYDSRYTDGDIQAKTYVPSTQPMPKTWGHGTPIRNDEEEESIRHYEQS